jgi:hypothetical protein
VRCDSRNALSFFDIEANRRRDPFRIARDFLEVGDRTGRMVKEHGGACAPRWAVLTSAWPTPPPTRGLGCHTVGPAAGDLIQEVGSGMEFGASAEDLVRSSHAHPHLGKSIMEAALAVHGRALHM